MKEEEVVGLICLLYDYEPKPKESGVKLVYGENKLKVFPIALIGQVNNFLKRKGYFNKNDSQPTIKLYKLLYKYNIRIDQIKDSQDEYEKTGHVTQYDKFGNEIIL